jgi:hypothetical protein
MALEVAQESPRKVRRDAAEWIAQAARSIASGVGLFCRKIAQIRPKSPSNPTTISGSAMSRSRGLAEIGPFVPDSSG